MKKIFYTLSFGLLLWGCTEPDSDIYEHSTYEPIIMQRDVFEKSISFQKAHSLQNIAKMYSFDNLLFISESYKGVHLIDNSDPSNPQNKGFLQIPGCIDIAYKDNVLYVSSAKDLIALDITDYQKPVELSRQKNIFPPLTDPEGNTVYGSFPENTIIIDWLKK